MSFMLDSRKTFGFGSTKVAGWIIVDTKQCKDIRVLRQFVRQEFARAEEECWKLVVDRLSTRNRE